MNSNIKLITNDHRGKPVVGRIVDNISYNFEQHHRSMYTVNVCFVRLLVSVALHIAIIANKQLFAR